MLLCTSFDAVVPAVSKQVMATPPSRAVRLEAMLVLGRLAARNRACQQDAVREGVVPVLVEMMVEGECRTHVQVWGPGGCLL
jgi:hypothetical protein